MPCPTTRRFPRTLREAFPQDKQWAYPVEASHRHERFEQIGSVLLAVAIGLGFALMLVHWWSS